MRKTFKSATLILASLATVFFIQSCDKNEHASTSPVIIFDEPADSTVIEAGSALHIEGEASDNDALHEGRFQIITDANVTLWDTAVTVHGLKEYHFHMHRHQTVSDTTHATLRATFSDHDELVTTKEVTLTFLP